MTMTQSKADVMLNTYDYAMDSENEPSNSSSSPGRVKVLMESTDFAEECSSKSDESSKEKETAIKQFAKKDAKEVRNMKIVILLVLLVTITGALSVYIYTRNTEQERFEEEFHDDAKKVLQAIGLNMERTLGAMDAFSAVITSIARASNQTFPYVRIPEWGIHAAKFLSLTGNLILYFNPIVTFEQRLEWEQYSSTNNTELAIWVDETLDYQETWSNFQGPKPQNYSWTSSDVIYSDFGDIPYNTSRPDGVDLHMPTWHAFPLIMTSYPPANYDWLSLSDNSGLLQFLNRKNAQVTKPFMIPTSNDPAALIELELWCEYYQDYIPADDNCYEPLSNIYYPIFDKVNRIELDGYYNTNDTEYVLAAQLNTKFYWHTKFANILPEGSDGIILVVNNTCGGDFTYQINGPSVKLLGVGDLHDREYNYLSVESKLHDLKTFFEEDTQYSGVPIDNTGCLYSFAVYPSDDMKDRYYTKNAIVFAASAAAFILLPFALFLLYDWKVTRQKVKLQDTAEKSDAIISSLFPAHVHDKLLAMESKKHDKSDFSRGGPIADLYPDTTVLLADIVNFTSWSSVRDPNQVFTLLETVYGVFDKRAEKRRVFKVETIGDCYVAVCGLPEPRKNHAIAMVLFAKDIINLMGVVTTQLETQLGPGTSDLSIRVGLNSGPTTAGVLRGSRGRYQLFGDTVNTAARMESNSLPGRILCSRKTADLIIAGGKEHWIAIRNDLVSAKGKGTLQCYWCNPMKTASVSSHMSQADEIPILKSIPTEGVQDSATKLVRWLIDLFEDMIVKIISNRKASASGTYLLDGSIAKGEFVSPRYEVQEIIVLPKVDASNDNEDLEETPVLDYNVRSQLRFYIERIVSMYRNNPFHNVQHAGHVIMATKKLLSRVIKPKESSASSTAYGITSDPLTQFAIVFSALIHDVDHPGVSNGQLVKEGSPIAHRYNNLNVSEQHSITISWDLLTSSDYIDLCNIIMPTSTERKRFRQLIVNSVMATDLFDADLKSLRERRWNTAFQTGPAELEEQRSDVDRDNNRRATIVIEHLIQAADVSHTMQHWHVYQLWNRRLFREMYIAYVEGRADKDPSKGWYDGELWFFDNYIIPLAKKLKTCGVFGVSCDELLDYAIDNRAEWAAKGKGIVIENIEEIERGDVERSVSEGSIRERVGAALDMICE